jgi:hypothetical protein
MVSGKGDLTYRKPCGRRSGAHFPRSTVVGSFEPDPDRIRI